MAQKQIPEYTDSQLIREIERVERKLPTADLSTADGREAYANTAVYYDELIAEAVRREDILGRRLTHSQGVTFDYTSELDLRDDDILERLGLGSGDDELAFEARWGGDDE